MKTPPEPRPPVATEIQKLLPLTVEKEIEIQSIGQQGIR